jgi:putative GTP pyrophosphokinase
MTHPDGLSKGQINRAGELLRAWRLGEELFDQSEVAEAVDTLEAFRRRFSSTQVLARVRIGAETMARRRVPSVEVVQRTKRAERIIGKLAREPGMQLSRMEDVAGCRLVVPTLGDLREVVARLEARWSPDLARSRDYISNPKATGYRGFHLVVRRDGLPVEVQIRTRNQHYWAVTVEGEEIRTGALLKDGKGPESLLRTFRAAAAALAEVDAGLITSEGEFNRRFASILEEG